MADLKSIDAVLKQILSDTFQPPETENLSLLEASGRVLAEDILSPMDVPPADNSAMDGYALDANDAAMVEQGVYEVSDRVPAGSSGKQIKPGTLVRIFTGGEIPPGANTVIMQENTELLDEGRVRIIKMPALGNNVREQGQDIQKGGIILTAGKRLQPQDLALLASVGHDKVNVYRRLRIAIITTGNELIDPPLPLKSGQIYNSNRYALESLVTQMGFDSRYYGTAEDTPEATEKAFTDAAKECDCLISSGGVSVGEEDHVKQVVQKLGSLDLWKVAIKPGKPLAFGQVLGRPFFGLPGNPVSSFVTFCLFTRPYLLRLQGCRDYAPSTYHVPVDFEIDGGSRVEFLRARVEPDNGGVRVNLFPNQGSGVMSSLSWANALVEVGIHQKVRKGDFLKIYPLENLIR